MRRLLLYVLLLCSGYISTIHLYAQEICGTDALLQRQLQEQGISYEQYTEQQTQAAARAADAVSRAASEDIYKIPVVFHILHFGAAIGAEHNLSKARIDHQMTVLNKAFAETHDDVGNIPSEFQSVRAGNTNIQFVLAKKDPHGLPTDGITRTQINRNGYPLYLYDVPDIKPAWNQKKYMNVWVVPGAGILSNILGAATYPGPISLPIIPYDGIILRTEAFSQGPVPLYGQGDILVHEVGHYLHLYHTWGVGIKRSCNIDDNCRDTPSQRGPTSRSRGCELNVNSCAETVNDKNDMSQNYMDYSSDACQVMFSACQKARMRSALLLHTYRKQLWEDEDKITTPVASGTNDIGIVSFTENAFNACDEDIEGKIRIANYGTNTINSVEIDLFLNDTKIECTEGSMSVACVKATALNLASFGTKDLSFNLPSCYNTKDVTLKATVRKVNNVTDTNSENDILTYTYKPEWHNDIVLHNNRIIRHADRVNSLENSGVKLTRDVLANSDDIDDLGDYIDDLGEVTEQHTNVLSTYGGRVATLEITSTTQTTTLEGHNTRIAAIEAKTIPPDYTADITALNQAKLLHAQTLTIHGNKISALENKASPPDHSAAITALQAGQTALERAKTNQEEINRQNGVQLLSQDSRITALESGTLPPTITSDISTLQSSQNAQDTKIAALEAAKSTQNSEITTLKEKIATLEAEIQKLKGSSTIVYHVPQAENKEPVRLYPNPSTQYLQFAGLSSTQSYTYKIYAPTGILLLSGTMHSPDTIDISSLSEGLYTLTLHTEEGKETLHSTLIVK